MQRQEFIPTPYRRLVTLTLGDLTENGDALLPGLNIRGAIVRFEIPASSTLSASDARRVIEAAGAFETRIAQAHAESVRRREHGVTAGLSPAEALDAWLEQKPDLKPLRDDLQAEAAQVEAAIQAGGNA